MTQKCIKMHRFACYNSKLFQFFRGLCPGKMLGKGYSVPSPTPPRRHSGAACLPCFARASMIPQCLLAVDDTACYHQNKQDRISTLALKPSFFQSHSLHSHLSFLRLISCNSTTRCLAVTGGGSVAECSILSQYS